MMAMRKPLIQPVPTMLFITYIIPSSPTIKPTTGVNMLKIRKRIANAMIERRAIAIPLPSEGRECSAHSGEKEFRYYFRTYGDGRMMKFEER